MTVPTSADAGRELSAGPAHPEGTEFGFVIEEAKLDTMPQVADELLGGRMPDRFTYYKAWETVPDFTPEVPDQLIGYGMQPLLTWEAMDPYRGGGSLRARAENPAYALRTILAGEHDAYIRRWAEQIRDWGKPLWIRLNHEMNLDIYPWCGACNGNTPQEYVQSFRHVVDIFREVGADNVKWNWSVNITGLGTVPLDQLYPGDRYVDEVGIDGYNGGDELDWGGWTTFGRLFGPTLEQVKRIAPGKPIHITETASTNQGGDRAEWIRGMFRVIEADPAIKGFTYFNLSKDGGGEGDWELLPGDEAADALREELARLNG